MGSTMNQLARLREAMAASHVSAYICRNNSDLFWLTALDGVFDEEQAHCAVVTAQEAILHTDSRYINAFDACRRRGLAPGWSFTTKPPRHSAFLTSVLAPLCAGIPGKVRVGIEANLPLDIYRAWASAFEEAGVSVELIEISSLIEGLRATKDEREVARLQAAQSVTDAAFAHICGFIEPGMTEEQVACELDFSMRRLGAQGLAFPSIVAAGENAASPHSQPGKRVIGQGDVVLLDFGARLDGYCSDMTRCLCVGQPSMRQQEVFDVVLAAQTAAEGFLSPGVTGAQAHQVAAKVIADAGFGGFFGHALGHGVGIDIHELPTLSPNNDRMLAVGSVVTVEPGIYLPDEFGIRIEDFGVITADGFQPFTRSPHSLVLV